MSYEIIGEMAFDGYWWVRTNSGSGQHPKEYYYVEHDFGIVWHVCNFPI